MCIWNQITFSNEKKKELSLMGWAVVSHEALIDGVVLVRWYSHLCSLEFWCCHTGIIFYFSGELLRPQRAKLVLTIRPAGMKQLYITDKNINVFIDIFRVLVLNWFFSQYKPILCTVGRAGASHKACTDWTTQHDWYNHVNDNKLNFLLLIHVFQYDI